MKTLGTTFTDILDNDILTTKEQDLLFELFKSYDVALDDDTISSIGGSYKLVEDTADDIALIHELIKAGEVFKLDFYQALGACDLVVMGKCTNNAGGDVIVLRKSLIQKYNLPKTI